MEKNQQQCLFPEITTRLLTGQQSGQQRCTWWPLVVLQAKISLLTEQKGNGCETRPIGLVAHQPGESDSVGAFQVARILADNLSVPATTHGCTNAAREAKVS